MRYFLYFFSFALITFNCFAAPIFFPPFRMIEKKILEDISPLLKSIDPELLNDSSSITPISGGYVSEVYRLKSNTKDLLLKFLPKTTTEDDFLKECYVTCKASKQKISPHFFGLDLKHRLIIQEFIPALDIPFLNPDSPLSQEYQHQTAISLSKFHSKLDYEPFKTIDSFFEQIIEQKMPYPQSLNLAMEKYRSIKDKFSNSQFPICYCHNDLHHQNVLIQKTNHFAYIIDWTTAKLGDPYFDIAKFSFNHSRPEDFLRHYLGREPELSELEHLKLSRDLLNLLICLNRLRHLNSKHPTNDSATRSNELEARLETLSMGTQFIFTDFEVGALVSLKRFLHSK